jgi:hypothetical protein
MSSPHTQFYSSPTPGPRRRSGLLRAAYVTGWRRASLSWLLLGIVLGALLRHALGPLV